MEETLQITKFPERVRVRIRIGNMFIKPDKSGADEKFPMIIPDYGVLWRVKKLGDKVINVKLTESGEHIIDNIAEKFMHIGEMVICSADNVTGNITFKTESSGEDDIKASLRGNEIVIDEALIKQLSE